MSLLKVVCAESAAQHKISPVNSRIVLPILPYDGLTSVLSKAIPILLFLTSLLHSESTLLECTADAWYSNHEAKLEGSARTLKLTASEDIILLAFRFAATEHWQVEKAVIVLHLAAESHPADLTVSLTNSPWSESSLKPPSLRDTSPAVEKIKPDHWISIPVPQAMAQALADGKATGLALSSAHTNQIFHSRETIQYSPFLAVMGQRH
jgi:hypothetical protein